MKHSYFLVCSIGTTIGIFFTLIRLYAIEHEKVFHIKFNNAIKNYILNSNNFKNLIIDKNKNVGILLDINSNKVKNIKSFKKSYYKVCQLNYDEIKDVLILDRIYSKIKYDKTYEELHKNIITILKNILNLFDVSTENNIEEEINNIEEEINDIENKKHKYLKQEYNSKLIFFSGKQSKDICVLFNETNSKLLIRFIEVIIYLLEQKNFDKYLTIKFTGKMINTFFLFLVDRNTLSHCKFTNIENSIENYLQIYNINRQEEIFVDGRKVFLINHVYKCLRLAFI